MTGPFSETTDGVGVRLTAAEAELLVTLTRVLAEVDADPSDTAYARLNPAAYPGDPSADNEFQRLMATEASEARRADRSAFETSAATAPAGTTLSFAEAEAWLRVLDEARLVLAVRLGIDTEAYEPQRELENAGEMRAFYDYLTWLQSELVEIALNRLPSS